jgi:predicted nucleic acid-binding protein
VIYVDASVALAQLFAEDVRPAPGFWDEPTLAASRLLEYEVWTRVHARGSAPTVGETVGEMLDRVAFLELTPPVLARALDPFPVPVRTLDALHLATVEFLRDRGERVSLASYDRRMSEAAAALGVPLVDMNRA